MAKPDPAGDDYRATAYVFGDEAGHHVKSIRKGLAPPNQLTAEARAQYEAIDLHFHDLRSEVASGWLEAGVPGTTFRSYGHADLTTTSTY
jgi:integrase